MIMKNIFSKGGAAGFLVIALVMLTSNCTNLTNGLSTDPVNVTNPSVIDASKYMTGVEVTLIGVFEGDQARQLSLWADYFSGEDRQYSGLSNYVTSGQDFDNEWVTIYTGIFTNTKLLKQNSRPAKNFVSIGIAEVIEGMCIGLAADIWGDVPYSQITQYPTITTPIVDTQASVYAAAQNLLDSAIIHLGQTGNAPGDFLLGGDKAAWTAVAHTVKARLFLHTRDYANATTHALSGIGSAAGNLMAPHGSAYLQTFNLYYSFLVYDRTNYMGANSYAPKLLDKTQANSRNNAKTDETARLNYIYYPGGGLIFGQGAISYEPNVLSNFDGWGNPVNQDGFFGGVTSFPIVTFQENQLILAEAYAKSGSAVNALASLNALRTYYATGAHVNSGYLPMGNNYAQYVYADFAPGGMENADNIAQDQALLREILEERYVTLIGQIEGWNDMRRTGNFLNLPVATGKPDYPRRGLYSQIEINTNPNVLKLSQEVTLYTPVTSFSTTY
jgi:hypothetical protein